jgi:hypothetical protein
MSRGRCGIPRKTQRLAEKIMTPREEGPRAQAFALGGRGLELRLGLSRIFHPDQRRSKIQRALRGLILEPGRVRLLHQRPELRNRRGGTDYWAAGKLDLPTGDEPAVAARNTSSSTRARRGLTVSMDIQRATGITESVVQRIADHQHQRHCEERRVQVRRRDFTSLDFRPCSRRISRRGGKSTGG